MGEGTLALITITAVTGSLYAANAADWNTIYSGFGSGGASAFIAGGAALITEGWGIPISFSETMLAVMVVLFAGTTMDAGLRLQRYIIQEWGNIYEIGPLKNNIISTLVAVFSCLILAFGASNGGYPGDGGMVIWPLFGASNQILAALTLLVISIFLMRLGRPAIYTLVPMIFIIVVAFWASAWYLVDYYRGEKWLLMALSLAVMSASIIVVLEAFSVIGKIRRGEKLDVADEQV